MGRQIASLVSRGLILCLLCCSCVLTPTEREPTKPSISISGENSGLIQSIEGGWIVDAYFKQRYDVLAAENEVDLSIVGELELYSAEASTYFASDFQLSQMYNWINQ